MLLLKDWLLSAAIKMTEANIPSPVLDAELILSYVLDKPRTYLHAHEDYRLSRSDIKKADKILKKRVDRMPLAYIVKEKEFYGRKFIVSPSVLIPRPESEDIIDSVKKIAQVGDRLIDVGAGSGCLGITLKLELPEINVAQIDKSARALKIAKKNANRFKLEIETLKSDLLKKYKGKANIVVANLPYVDKTWEVSPELSHEPKIALFADDNGLYLIKKLITQSVNKLENGGYMILEADPAQHQNIVDFAVGYGYKHLDTAGYVVTLRLTKNQ